MPLLVFSAFLDYLAILLAILSTIGFVYFFYYLLILPGLKIRAIKEAPPQEGTQRVILLQDHNNVFSLVFGQLYGNFNFRLQGIRERHLVITLTKDPGVELYDISFDPNGIVFLQVPHTRFLERIRSTEVFSSAELIGHPAIFRIVDQLVEDKALHYIEFQLSADYIVSQGEGEKLRFLVRIEKIMPSIDLESRNKNGIYTFGQSKFMKKKEEEEESNGGEEE